MNILLNNIYNYNTNVGIGNNYKKANNYNVNYGFVNAGT